MKRLPVRQMTRCAFFTALTAVCAWIGIPLGGTVFTMQTLAVFLSLGLLGGRWGGVSIVCYLLLGAAGVPVFSGFRGGFGVLLGPTGGFLWGFLCTGLCWQVVEKTGKLPALLLGQLVCYGCGTLWYMLSTGTGWAWAAAHSVAPYLLPDLVKLLLARRLTERLRGHL